MKDYHIRPDCRLCGGGYHEVLRLPDTPLANEYLDTAEASLAQDRFPLYLVECDECGHFQLPVVVNPERLFRNYAYQSGTSPVFREHLKKLAQDTNPGPGELVVDIASNDGSLLKEYKKLGCRVLGVDPAKNLAEKASAYGIPTMPEFFTGRLTAEAIRLKWGKAKLITALNVMAHVDDLHGIIEGVKGLLADDGMFVFEVGYFPEVCRLGLFDTIYHEHLSYHTIEPLRRFFESHGMFMNAYECVDSQGGSLRGYVRNTDPLPVAWVNDKPDVANLKLKVDTLRWALERRRSVAVFGCPAKLTTFSEAIGMRVTWAFDENPLKVGRHVPGTLSQIYPAQDLLSCEFDDLLISSWNFADDIMQRLRAQGYKGRFVVPLPELRVYE